MVCVASGVAALGFLARVVFMRHNLPVNHGKMSMKPSKISSSSVSEPLAFFLGIFLLLKISAAKQARRRVVHEFLHFFCGFGDRIVRAVHFRSHAAV